MLQFVRPTYEGVQIPAKLVTLILQNMSSLPKPSEIEISGNDPIALNELMEVEACLREMLQSTSDPAVLQRLYQLHRDIQRYVAELNSRKP